MRSGDYLINARDPLRHDQFWVCFDKFGWINRFRRKRVRMYIPTKLPVFVKMSGEVPCGLIIRMFTPFRLNAPLILYVDN